MDLAQVGRELGLLVAAGGDIGVRGDDLAPRAQARRWVSLDRQDRRLTALSSRLLVETHAQQLLLLPLDLAGLLG